MSGLSESESESRSEGNGEDIFGPLLPFPPVTRSHILKCSCHSWKPRFRILTPKSRIIPLSDAFLSYLRADGIILPPEPGRRQDDHPRTSTFSPTVDSDSALGTEEDSASTSTTSSDDAADQDPSSSWPGIHSQIQSAIAELGGKVLPKLNWSAPKDATWMSATNDMECRSANEVYLLLKSSDFVTHDLEQAFDGCGDDGRDDDDYDYDEDGDGEDESEDEEARSKETTETQADTIPYVLVLRKSFNLNPALEFRCFVRDLALVAISQREMNHFAFMSELRPRLKDTIEHFFQDRLLTSDYFGPETTSPTAEAERGKGKKKQEAGMSNFVFDVYIPPPHDRAWLIDINPWAPRTDPLLFSWSELLDKKFPSPSSEDAMQQQQQQEEEERTSKGADDFTPAQTVPPSPPFRLVKRDDPEAYQFSSTKFSAHKLPRDVVDATTSMNGGGGDGSGGGIGQLMHQWKRALDRRVDESDGDDDDDDGEDEG